MKYANFGPEGSFKNYMKGNNKRYFIFHYVIEEDKLTIDAGDPNAIRDLMKAKKIKPVNGFFQVPPRLLANYFEKNGPRRVFNGKAVHRFRRVK